MSHPLAIPAYRPRRTWPLGNRDLAGWTVKLYAMTASGAALAEATLEAAWSHALEAVQPPESAATPYGFLLVHEGNAGVWLLVDLWAADILEHHLFRAPLDDPTHFGPAPFQASAACVWELEVVLHERDAWVRHVLSRPEQPEFERYLKDVREVGLEESSGDL